MLDPALRARSPRRGPRRPAQPRPRRRRGARAARDARDAAPAADSRARGAEARAEHGRRRGRARQARRGRTRRAIFAANKARGAADPAARDPARPDRAAAHGAAADAAEPAARERAGRADAPRTTWRCAGTASRARSTSSRKPHWDLGPALGILDFERATRMSRRALLGADRRRRAARARADQLHARPAHARARLHARSSRRSSSTRRRCAAPGNLPKFEQDLFKIAGEWDLYPDPDRRGAADEPAPRRDPRRPAAAAPLHRLHAVLPQRGRARTAPTCAA